MNELETMLRKATRKNQTQACVECKKKHRKCSGGHPCEFCISKGARCIFNTQEKRGPKPKLEKIYDHEFNFENKNDNDNEHEDNNSNEDESDENEKRITKKRKLEDSCSSPISPISPISSTSISTSPNSPIPSLSLNSPILPIYATSQTIISTNLYSSTPSLNISPPPSCISSPISPNSPNSPLTSFSTSPLSNNSTNSHEVLSKYSICLYTCKIILFILET